MTSSAKRPYRKAPDHKEKYYKEPRRQAAKDKYRNFKDCTKCGQTKRFADFALVGDWRKKRANNPKRYRKVCKECTRASNAAKVDPNFKPKRKPPAKGQTKEQKQAAHAAYKRKVRRETRIKIMEYLSERGCEECGERDPRVLEFDHIDTYEKKIEIARLISSGYSWSAQKLRQEIRKCRVLCANCHRKHSINQAGHYSEKSVRDALQRILAEYDIDE
jgi:hypothetical protein